MKHLIMACALFMSFAVTANETTVTVTTEQLKVEKVSCTLFARKLKLKVAGMPAGTEALGRRGLKTERVKGCAGVRDQIRKNISSRNNSINANVKKSETVYKRTEYRDIYRDYPHYDYYYENYPPRRPRYPGYGRYPGYYQRPVCVTYKLTEVEATSQAVRRGDAPLIMKRAMTREIDRKHGHCRD